MSRYITIIFTLILSVLSMNNAYANEKQTKGVLGVVDDPLDFKVNYVYRSSGNTEFLPLTDNSVLHNNDAYKIIFTPAENSYVYIFQKDGANAIFQLFPMTAFQNKQYDNSNPVRKNQKYYIPAREKSFILDAQTGKETIYFLATRQRDKVLEKQYAQMLQAQQAQNPVAMKQTSTQFLYTIQQKGLKKIKNDRQNLTWKEQGTTFSVLQQRLTDICTECVHILRFQHQP